MDNKIKTLPFKCVLCNVTLYSHKCIQTHEDGIRHKNNMVMQRYKSNNSFNADLGAAKIERIDLQSVNTSSTEYRHSSSTGVSTATLTNVPADPSLYKQHVHQGDTTKESNECNDSLEGNLSKNGTVKQKKEYNTSIDGNFSKTEPFEHVFQGIDMIRKKNKCNDSNTNHLSQDGLKCNLCNIFLSSKKIKKDHLQGSMHKVALTLEKEKLRKPICGSRIRKTHKETKKVRTLKRHLLCKQYRNIKGHLKNSILIKDFPHSLTNKEILKYFSTREKVVNSFFRDDNQYAVIEFRRSASLNEILSKDVILEGRKLEIEPANYSDKEIEAILNFKKINETIKDLPNFQTQIDSLIEQVQPNWLLNKYKVLCADLQTILQEIFPGCVVFPFGAADTGLGFTTSVVDIHVDIFKAEGTSKDSECHNHHETYYIDKSKELLQLHNLVFLIIPKDNTVGKVECVHSPTKLKCDFYFTKWLSIRSTSLIRYYLSLDSKLKSLMIIIKYWGTVHQLIGAPRTFSTYSLTMLLVFYLQQSPYLLPSVVSMPASQNPVKTKEFWNTEFVPLEHFVSEPLFNRSIPEILHGFFDYYTNFDYLLKIICPYLGKPIPKTELFNPEFLANKFPRNTSKGFNTKSAICLQDPFKHHENVTPSLPTKFLKKFIGLCGVGADIFANLPVDHLALHKLFIPPPTKYYISATNYHFPIRMKGHLRYISSVINKSNSVLLNPEKRPVETRKIWYNLVNNFIFAIFTDLMKFTIDAEDDRPDIKSQRLNEQADVYDTGIIDFITFQCSRSGTYNIQSAKKDRTILKGINLDDQTKLINLMCRNKFILNGAALDVKMQARINPTEIMVFLTAVKLQDMSLKTFGKFLTKYVPAWFEKYITELDKSVLFKNKSVQSDKLECIQPKSEDLESDEPTEEEFGKLIQIKSESQGNGNEDVKLETELVNNETERQTFEKFVQIKYEPEEFRNDVTEAVAQIKSEPVEAEVQKTEYVESNSEI